MKKVYYNKLVRDLIADTLSSKGIAYEMRTIEDGDEFQQELLKKVREEAGALSSVRSREAFLSEYADLMAVLDALTTLLDFSEADIKVALEENVAKKGFYHKRHFLHWSADEGYESNETPQGVQSV